LYLLQAYCLVTRVYRFHLVIFFFFSSRRRHTRFSRDWSSDVCSSDLVLDRAREVLSASGKVPSEEETLVRALEDLLEKRDPMRKAARAAQRKVASTAVPKSNLTAVPKSNLTAVPKSNLTAVPKSKVTIDRKHNPARSAVIQTSQEKIRRGVPAAIAHQVWERDQGCCSYVGPNGERCRSRI